jgi:acyl dehydratase
VKLPSEVVGLTAGPLAQTIDARWLMAYAAGLGETDARYYDTRRTDGPVPHPVFPVCYEWPLAQAIRERAVPATLELRSVHATHDLRIHRPPRAGETLWTSGRVIAVVRRPPGALRVVRYETVDQQGAPVTTTDYGSIYRGVEVDGPDRQLAEWSAGEAAAVGHLPPVGDVDIPATRAHVYTECARIWNPIHTDVAVAVGVGLPGIILHGTATLALAVSRVLRALGRDPARVRRIACRFTGMTSLPSRLIVRARPGEAGGAAIDFDALGVEGRPVLGRGLLIEAP